MQIEIANKRHGGKGEYVARPSPLGNPFVIGRDGTRQEVIAKYRRWLYQQITAGNSAVTNELKRLHQLAQNQPITLVCWCTPQQCHAEVVRSALTWMDNQ